MHEWEVRIRTPKGMDNVSIAVDPDTEEEARLVAQFHIGRQGSPAYRLVYVRRHIVCTSAERRAALTPEEPPVGPVHQEYAQDAGEHDLRARAKKEGREAAKTRDAIASGRIGG